MGRFLGITGTPGTGKKSVAFRVALSLGLPCFALNQFVTKSELEKRDGAVDTSRLRHRIIGEVREKCVIFGHLLPEVLVKGDIERVLVLRCNPDLLKHRLSARGYAGAKLASNVEAELIGLVSAACDARFGPGKVFEFDTTSKSPSTSAKAAAGILAGSRRGRRVDWIGFYSSGEKLRSLLSGASADSAFT